MENNPSVYEVSKLMFEEYRFGKLQEWEALISYLVEDGWSEKAVLRMTKELYRQEVLEKVNGGGE
jgi:hypothetical protein